MTRDSAVQTIVEITINDKYTLLDDDTLIVLESEKSYIQTNFESDADLPLMMRTIKFYLSNGYISKAFSHYVYNKIYDKNCFIMNTKVMFSYHSENKLEKEEYNYFSQSFYLLIIFRVFFGLILRKKYRII